MTVYEFAKKCMQDEEFNRGGIVKNERKLLDSVGFEYTMQSGVINSVGKDASDFYIAMESLRQLNKKYSVRL